MSIISEIVSLARRSSAVNHLKNGNFLNVPKQFTAINNYGGITGLSRVFRTNYSYAVTTGTGQSTAQKLRVPGFYIVAEPPAENFMGFWDVWGVNGIASFNDLGESFDGGHLLGIEFMDKGKIYLKQVVQSFDKFRGKTVSLALSGKMVRDDVKVVMSIDTGEKTIESRPYFSRYFGSYTRMVATFEIGLAITKFEVTVTLDAMSHAVVGLSGAMLAMGPYHSVLPYADSPSDVAIPSGTVIFYAGAVCPPGYRSIADDAYLFVSLGDPNAIRGNMNSTYGGVKMTADPMIGENRHDHQASGANELQPAAFDVLEGRFEGPPIEAESVPELSVRPLANYEVAHPDEPYFGPKEYTLQDEHNHLFLISGETIEPPRVAFKICEKI